MESYFCNNDSTILCTKIDQVYFGKANHSFGVLFKHSFQLCKLQTSSVENHLTPFSADYSIQFSFSGTALQQHSCYLFIMISLPQLWKTIALWPNCSWVSSIETSCKINIRAIKTVWLKCQLSANFAQPLVSNLRACVRSMQLLIATLALPSYHTPEYWRHSTVPIPIMRNKNVPKAVRARNPQKYSLLNSKKLHIHTPSCRRSGSCGKSGLDMWGHFIYDAGTYKIRALSNWLFISFPCAVSYKQIKNWVLNHQLPLFKHKLFFLEFYQ